MGVLAVPTAVGFLLDDSGCRAGWPRAHPPELRRGRGSLFCDRRLHAFTGCDRLCQTGDGVAAHAHCDGDGRGRVFTVWH